MVGFAGSTASSPVRPTIRPARISPIITGTNRPRDRPSNGPPSPARTITVSVWKLMAASGPRYRGQLVRARRTAPKIGLTPNFLTSSNEKKLNETGDKLDGAIKARAAAYGFTFVDARAAFLPHEVCSSEEWRNGQSNPLEESYHPNVKGQKEFTSEVEAVLP